MNRKRKQVGKGGVAQLEKQVARQEKNLYNELISLISQERLNISPHQLQMVARALKQKSQLSIDIGYLRTVLFPELYGYDIPQPLSNMSYCRFTDKQEATLGTGTDGSNGCGMIVWYPKTNYGPSLFYFPAQSSSVGLDQFPIALSAGSVDITKWRAGFSQNYDQYFSQTCLVAASISLQYVGQIQTESGYFVGSMVYSTKLNSMVVDDVENGQFRVLAKPGEGIRIIYLPKDSIDYTYYPTKTGIAHNQGITGKDEDSFTLPATYNNLTNTSTATGQSVTYTSEGPCIAIYWKGLPASQNVLRIDSTRKFNGIPKQNIRDIVEVSRPKRQYDQKKTTDVLQQLILSVPQIGGHTIKQMDHVSDQIQQYLPNIGHLYSSGLLKEGMTLHGLSQGLALQQSGLEGPITNAGRIWDNE